MRLALAAAVLFAATSALAAEPDAPVATASATTPSVAEQIDAYPKSSPALEVAPEGDMDGIVPRADRKPHGEVSVAVGTGGYRSLYARSTMPVGETGQLTVAIEDTKFGRNGGYGYGPYGYRDRGGQRLGLAFSSAAPLGPTDRQRCDLEGMTPSRPLDVTGGPHGACVRPIPRW